MRRYPVPVSVPVNVVRWLLKSEQVLRRSVNLVARLARTFRGAPPLPGGGQGLDSPRLHFPRPFMKGLSMREAQSLRAICTINEGMRCCSDERVFEGPESEGCRCRRPGHPEERDHKDFWRLFADHRTLHQKKEGRWGSHPKALARTHTDHRCHSRAKKSSMGAA